MSFSFSISREHVQLRAPHFLYHLIPCDIDDCLRYSNCTVSKSKAVFEHGPGRKLSIVPKQDLVAYSLFFSWVPYLDYFFLNSRIIYSSVEQISDILLVVLPYVACFHNGDCKKEFAQK